MNVLSDQLHIEFDASRDCLAIRHATNAQSESPLIEVRCETLQAMSFDEATRFVGERILLLMPSMREQFKDYLWTDDGDTPPKKT
jgi:hypothetical protein